MPEKSLKQILDSVIIYDLERLFKDFSDINQTII